MPAKLSNEEWPVRKNCCPRCDLIIHDDGTICGICVTELTDRNIMRENDNDDFTWLMQAVPVLRAVFGQSQVTNGFRIDRQAGRPVRVGENTGWAVRR